MRKKDSDDGPKGAPEWMLTYSDVMSLLVTFFVMLLTFSTADREKFDKASGSLRGALGVAMPKISRLPQTGMITDRFMLRGRSTPAGIDFPPETEPLARIATDINARLKNEKFGTPLTMQRLTRGVLLRIPASLIFIRNTAVFAPQGQDYLYKVARAVQVLSNEIEIISHVGSEFENSFQLSAWKLTQQRSAKVAVLFQKSWGIAAERLSVGGMGASRPLGRNLEPRDNRIEMTLLNRQEGVRY